MVALLRTGRRPWVEYAGRVEDRGSAVAVLEEELAAAAAPTGQTTLFPDGPDSTRTADGTTAERAALLDEAVADLDRWSTAGMRLVTVLEPEYPPNLRAVHDRPPMVFVAGRLTPEDARGVAVVGARKATHAGSESARAIAEHLVDRGFTVVSGLAAGIDTAAHCHRYLHKTNTYCDRRIGLVARQMDYAALKMRVSFIWRCCKLCGLTTLRELFSRKVVKPQRRLGFP